MESNIEEMEAVEFGIRRENIYVRQRRALREMEEKRNGKQTDSSTAKSGEHHF